MYLLVNIRISGEIIIQKWQQTQKEKINTVDDENNRQKCDPERYMNNSEKLELN